MLSVAFVIQTGIIAQVHSGDREESYNGVFGNYFKNKLLTLEVMNLSFDFSKKVYLLSLLLFLSICSCQSKLSYQELHRPQFHFSPPKNWMNDPNGLVYYDGEFHLYYQYYPDSNVWGPMHWAHAISEDLVHWKHLPVALFPDSLGTIFSGSAVLDWENTAGLQTGNLPLGKLLLGKL